MFKEIVDDERRTKDHPKSSPWARCAHVSKKEQGNKRPAQKSATKCLWISLYMEEFLKEGLGVYFETTDSVEEL